MRLEQYYLLSTSSCIINALFNLSVSRNVLRIGSFLDHSHPPGYPKTRDNRLRNNTMETAWFYCIHCGRPGSDVVGQGDGSSSEHRQRVISWNLPLFLALSNEFERFSINRKTRMVGGFRRCETSHRKLECPKPISRRPRTMRTLIKEIELARGRSRRDRLWRLLSGRRGGRPGFRGK